MEMQNSHTMTELVTATNSNKRKRRSTVGETDIENQRPSKKKAYGIVEDGRNYDSDIQSSSTEFDLYNALGSPQAMSILNKLDGSLQRNQQNGRSAINNNNNNNINAPSTAIDGESTPHQHHKTTAAVTTTTAATGTTNDAWNACTKCCTSQSRGHRLCPLPVLSWAEAKDVWKFMCKKDEKAAIERDSKMLSNHPGLQPRMRAILLDWLIEVCEVYKLHRETYFLALDYLDRYLSTNVSISKTHLQLIGITCLFIAAKVEEIYPPKLNEFAYVTDGACREEDILKQELVILTALKWRISPVTIIGWLSCYMQLNVTKRTPKTLNKSKSTTATTNTSTSGASAKASSQTATTTTTHPTASSDDDQADDAFVFPQFSGMEFAQTAQLIDLCTLDLGIANYSYSVIAAAAISHTFNKKTAIKLSGLEWAAIAPCSRWMESFFRICLKSPKLCLLENNDQVKSTYGLGHVCPNLTTDDSHIIQMHTTNMDMFDEAMQLKEQSLQEASPAPALLSIEHTCPPEGLLTPPASNRKFIDAQPDSTFK